MSSKLLESKLMVAAEKFNRIAEQQAHQRNAGAAEMCVNISNMFVQAAEMLETQRLVIEDLKLPRHSRPAEPGFLDELQEALKDKK